MATPPPLCRMLDGPLQPPLNSAEFGAPAYYTFLHITHYKITQNSICV